MDARALSALVAKVRKAIDEFVPGHAGGTVSIRLHTGDRVRLEFASHATSDADANGQSSGEQFIPSEFQAAILAALEGKALRSDPLGDVVDDRRRLFRHPGGLKELQERGLVCRHSRLGYYRPDAPPEALGQN